MIKFKGLAVAQKVKQAIHQSEGWRVDPWPL